MSRCGSDHLVVGFTTTNVISEHERKSNWLPWLPSKISKAKEQYFSCSSSSCISTNETFINTGVINN